VTLQRFGAQSELRKITANTFWIVTDNILNIFAGLIVAAWVAKYLGPSIYGQLSFAIAFVAIFVPIVTLGLKEIMIRNIIRHPDQKYLILGTAFTMQFISGLIVLILSYVLALIISPEDQLVQVLIAIITVSLVFRTFNLTLINWFESQLLSKYIVWARNIALIIISIVKIGLILLDASVVAFALAILVEILLIGIGLVFLYQFSGERIIRWRIKLQQAKLLLQDSWPLIISGLAVAIYMKIDQIMLGKMASSEALGIYSAAVKVSELWYFIPLALASSFFPSIIRSRIYLTNEVFNKRIQAFFDLMAGSAYLIVIPLVLIAPQLINILFGQEYAEAGKILQIHIWAYLFISIEVARRQWLMVENMTKFAMIATIIGAGVNIGLNLVLIPKYEGLGSAWATLISYAVAGFFTTALSVKIRPLFKQLSLSLLIPFRLPAFVNSVREIL
jgi:O-antigen/teichoic acid export membrane protein